MKKELTFGRNGMFLLLVFASGMLFSGCRKDKKNPTRFEIMAHQPHLDLPVSGVKWTIRERKYKGWGNGHKLTGWTMEGETDLNGRASGEFPPKKNLDYTYVISFDYSSADVPNGPYDVNIPSNQLRVLGKAAEGINDYEIRMLPKMDITIHYKNTNCFDASDTFKYKSYNIDQKNYPVSQSTIDGWPWTESSFFDGCVDYSSTPNKLAGHYIYIWEAVRNGTLETGVDTFFVSPGINSTINMHW